ncbi:MAG TPA: DUF4037 domain-containing protein [Pyrinomonadaceae bacterium]|jgi:hypothetical protein|nr:DUF4037 domain-containing protein [Pyrinomonadaceae bacterium]
MPDFVKGLALGQAFYEEAARPIIEKHFPQLRYSAAIIGWGSEVLGYDDAESTDHHWGPRFLMFLDAADRERYEQPVSDALSANLPYRFRGYSTNFIPADDDDPVRLLKEIDEGPVNHMVHIETIESLFGWYLGVSPFAEITLADWLTFSEHKLLALTSGRVFHDGLKKLEDVRRKFGYYPQDVWLYLLACEWQAISQEEAFIGRAGFVGDELGSAVIAARMVKRLMRLCFLFEKTYAPYSKWFGTAFARLKCGPELTPIFRRALHAENWRDREAHLSKAYEYVGRMQNELKIAAPVDDKVSLHGRPYMIIHARRFGMAILDAIEDEEVQRLNFFGGSVNQFVEDDNEVGQVALCQKLKILYQPSPPPRGD